MWHEFLRQTLGTFPGACGAILTVLGFWTAYKKKEWRWLARFLWRFALVLLFLGTFLTWRERGKRLAETSADLANARAAVSEKGRRIADTRARLDKEIVAHQALLDSPPTPVPLPGGLRIVQRVVASNRPDARYALKLTIQTDSLLGNPIFAIKTDKSFETFQAREPHHSGIHEDGTLLTLNPLWVVTPESPCVVVFYSKEPLQVVSVTRPD